MITSINVGHRPVTAAHWTEFLVEHGQPYKVGDLSVS